MGKKLTDILGKDHLDVTGSDKIVIPNEILDYFKGKGMPLDFAKKYYGLNEGIDVKPTERQLNGRWYS